MTVKSIGITCPHCGSKLKTHGHKRQSLVFKNMVGICTNTECLFVARIGVEIYKEIHPSLKPNKTVKLQRETA